MPTVRYRLEADGSSVSRTFKKLSAEANDFGKTLLTGVGLGGGFAVGEKLAEGLIGAFKAVPQAAGAAVGAIASAVKMAADLGGKLTDLSAKTGISVEGLQRLGHAAKLGGSTMEAAAKGVNVFQRTMVSGGAETEKIAKAMGLSFDKLRKMAPEDAFLKTADAIRGLKNPTDQAAAAMTLFGKSGAELLPAIKSGLAEAAEQADRLGLVMSTATAESLDSFGDNVDTARSTLTGLLTNFGAAIAQSPVLQGAIVGITEQLGKLSKEIQNNSGEITGFVNEGVAGFLSGMVELTKAGAGVVFVLEDLGSKVDGLRSKFSGLGGGALAKGLRDALPAPFSGILDAFSMGKAGVGRLADLGDEAGSLQSPAGKFMAGLVKAMQEAEKTARTFRVQLSGGGGGKGGVAGDLELVGKNAKKAKEELGRFDDGVLGPFKAELSDVFAGLATPGGGANLHRVLGDTLTKGMSGVSRGLIGIIGQEDALAQPIEKVVEETVKWSDVLDDVANAFRVLGIDADSTLGGILGGITAAASAIERIDLSKGLKGGASGKKGFSNLLGNLTGGLQLVGAGASIAKGIGGLFGIGGDKEHMQVNDLRDAFFEAQGGFEQLQKSLSSMTNQDLVKKIFDAKTVDAFNAAVAEATGLLDTQALANEKARDVIERYGLSIDQLGPKWRQQELDKLAGSLLSDFTIMTEGIGVSMDVALDKMGPAFNAFVQQAIAAGGTLPEALRPVLQSLVDSGQLLDANGNAFQNLESTGLTFAQTMSESLQGLTEELRNLVAALTGVPAVRVPVEFDVRGGIPNFDPGRFENSRLEGFSSAGGFGRSSGTRGTVSMVPKRLKSDTMFQAHEGEFALIAPKKFRVKAVSAADGFGGFDQSTDDGGGGSSGGGGGGGQSPSGGGGTTSPAPQAPSGGGGGGRGTAPEPPIIERVRQEQRKTQQLVEQVAQLVKKVAEQPQSVQVTTAQNISIDQNPLATLQDRQDIARFNIENLKLALRQRDAELIELGKRAFGIRS